MHKPEITPKPFALDLDALFARKLRAIVPIATPDSTPVVTVPDAPAAPAAPESAPQRPRKGKGKGKRAKSAPVPVTDSETGATVQLAAGDLPALIVHNLPDIAPGHAGDASGDDLPDMTASDAGDFLSIALDTLSE